jgi:hypothetical protein
MIIAAKRRFLRFLATVLGIRVSYGRIWSLIRKNKREEDVSPM